MVMYICDQFGWLQPDYPVVKVSGTRQEILELYNFYRNAFPTRSLGLVTEEEFEKKKPKWWHNI